MNFKRFILILLCVLAVSNSFGQREGGLVQSRILILLDESSSMTQPWSSGKEKYKAAREIILRLMDSVYAVNRNVEFSLRVFGHQHTVEENFCYDTKNEVPFSSDNRYQMAARLEDIHPLGVTPIGFALSEAAEKDIIDEAHNAYSIILITDGGESCGGDICEVMKKLIKYKVYFKPYIVSLENDPSLKVTYSCMGDFLQVTKEKDIPKAVSTIVEAFRPVIKLNDAEFKELQNIAAKAPSVMKVTTPAIKTDTVIVKKWSKPAAEKVINLPFAGMVRIATVIEREILSLVETGFKLPKVVVDTPVAVPFTHPIVKMYITGIAGIKPFVIKPPVQDRITHLYNDIKLPKPVGDTVQERQIDNISKVKLARLKQFNVIFVIEDHTYAMRPIPPLPAVKVEPNTAPATPNTNKHEFKVETTDEKETTVSVYFTNGMGKYYTTTPQVILLDPATKKPVRKFFRTVDPAGNPDPQPDIAPGVYDLTLAARPDYMLTGVKVEKNKNNKVTVVVNKTSLSFAYENATGRPVKEFMAQVTERNKSQGRVEVQKCTETILYEAGNYHIEINTFPQDVRNVDLDFDGETVITIPLPGTAKFGGDLKVNNAMLYRQYGDKYIGFFPLNLADPKNQKLQIQPGAYQIHYKKPNMPPGSLSEQVIPFIIKANKETEIILK